MSLGKSEEILDKIVIACIDASGFKKKGVHKSMLELLVLACDN